jgi:hypothetical protein
MEVVETLDDCGGSPGGTSGRYSSVMSLAWTEGRKTGKVEGREEENKVESPQMGN